MNRTRRAALTGLQLVRAMRTSTTTASTTASTPPFYDSCVQEFARRPITQLSLDELLKWGEKPVTEARLLESARYVSMELPKRLARRVHALQRLPYIVGINPHLRDVYQLYRTSFEQLRAVPEIKTAADDEAFTRALSELVESHAEVIPLVARGIHECSRYMDKQDITDFLNRMILDRIGIRVIAEQHIALHQHRDDPHMRGILNDRCCPARIVKRAAPLAQELCELNYGSAPDIIVNGHTDTVFPYIDVHLEYMVFELLKNAFRATVDYSRKIDREKHPPIEVTIGASASDADVTIRIRDRGGGISESRERHVFDYSYSTVDEEEAAVEEAAESIFTSTSKLGVVQGTGGPMAGLGYGLPMTRIYAEWVGGSLKLVSLYEHGCDLFLRLPNIGSVDQALKI